ncbi:Ldh family oxidoreductase [Noviherbaspirillum pedocola]|uniref:Ldh family oxidoreductase n=1 Tax=Noviherbaspirillum pedocola TaxID=2801341 RepID=A0A934SYS5_9BURK|nr:Ldh family oxidoreductase [Noviherbaspirillum pedocola]MBK4735149.1 Ldh family oxidoreductase [Noviherbaspirillum pedocola]
MAAARYSPDALRRFATELLRAAGLDAEPAAAVADTLVLGDLLGHDTHGLALLAPYVKEIEAGTMTRSGAPEVLSDRGAALAWDGRRLPGPWLVTSGLEALMPRARQYGSASLAIRRSHHIACLATYLLRATEAGFMMVLASSDPAVASVAPHGGTRAVFTPNPIAAGIPTSGTPILIDISASVTTNGMSNRLHRAGQQFDEPWMLDAQGNPSTDPGVLFTGPPGTIQPLGGLAAGHKGYGLALLIEALTGGLSGHGRGDAPEGWGATVFMTLYDPSAFGGMPDYLRQMDTLAQACRDNPPRPGFDAVRLPGDRALARRARAEAEGLELHPSIAPMLLEAATRHGLPMPAPLGE